MNFDSLQRALEENGTAVEKALEEFFKVKNTEGCLKTISDAQKYSLLNGGKRIRPFLVNRVCAMLGGSIEASMPYALAVEMIHTYSLIHDDLPCMDNDDFRRGKPSNHKAFGEANALLAGDALLTNAFLAASSNAAVSPESNVRAMAAIAKAAGDEGMIGGQIIDIDCEGKKISFEELLKLHSLKTGKMIELSALLGCIAAGVSEDDEKSKSVCSYARKIGLAFQAIDDLLDVIGDEKTVGKSLSSDAENGKTTFLSFFDVNEVKKYARELTESAVEDISKTENSQTLKELAYYLLERNK